jgi:hypothetical protein
VIEQAARRPLPFDDLAKRSDLALHRITVLIETNEAGELESLQQSIETAICPAPVDAPVHRCPNRWMMMTSTLTDDEVRELGDLDEFLNS